MAAYDDRLGGFEFDVVRASVFFSIVHRDNNEVYTWRTRGAHEASVEMCRWRQSRGARYMAVTAVVAHANNMMEECRDTVEFDCREKVCPESNGTAVHTKGKRRNAQTLLHMCEHVKAL